MWKVISYYCSTNSKLRLPSFQHFPLVPSIHKYLESQNIHTPTYIQYGLLSKIYPETKPISETNHYHIVSHTGSGKTLAYMLPIVNSMKIAEQKEGTILTKSQRPRAIIFTSNKQLVLQARNVGKQMSHHCKIRCEGLSIGRTLKKEEQIIKNGIDILVTSYLRFSRMLEKKQIFISNLDWIVVDQIDTMLQSQQKQLSKMFNQLILPKTINLRNQYDKRVTLILSSTTNPQNLSKYIEKHIPNKYLQRIVDKKTHLNLQNIKHQFIQCQHIDKHQPLLQQLKRSFKNGRKGTDKNYDINKILIFCNTVKSLHQLQYFLQEVGITKNLFTLHSQLSKNLRRTNYQRFRDLSSNQQGILLSTDLGARGLHFPNLNYIINYDFPFSTCDYLQRAGRTGRGGNNGFVVSLYHQKNIGIINELKGASFDSPLKIRNSAYGYKNRQETQRPNKFSH